MNQDFNTQNNETNNNVSNNQVFQNNLNTNNGNVYNPNNVSSNNPYYQNLKHKKSKIRIITLLILLALILICSRLLILYINNKNKIDFEIDETTTINEVLWNDFQNGKIDTDEYVKNILYAEYDNDLLDKKYQNIKTNDLIHTDVIVNKYYDELSEETLKYYLSKINLENITFELDSENEENNDNVALSDLFVDKVNAKSDKITNLNKVVLSKNGNFVVWYTTTGDSKTSYESAKKVADGLENTIEKYKQEFGYDYSFNANVISKGKTYKNQVKILNNSNIDSKYLESAMQVYLVNYNNGSLAMYLGRTAPLGKLWNSIKGGDENGAIISPYILIKPSSFSDFERLEQLYNHELFHHYQYEVLCGSSNCSVSSDPYILEATANWASSIVSNKSTNYGYLNEWAGTARSFSSSLLSETFEKKYGVSNVGYAMYVYLNNYSNYVNNGTSNIVKSIYENDSLYYLNNNADITGLTETQKTIALKNITQDYTNKNLNVDLNYGGEVPLEDTIKSNKNNNIYNDVDIPAIGIDYYYIDLDSTYAFTFKLIRDNSFVGAYVIAKQNGKYNIVESSPSGKESYTFDTNKYDQYESLYLAIVNYGTLDNYYSLNINPVEKVNKVENNNKNYISLTDCDAYFNEDIDKQIVTYYYEDETITRWIITTYWKEEEYAIANEQSQKNNSNFMKVKRNNKKVSSEYTKDAIQKYFSNQTKSSVINGHNMSCSADATVDFTPDI